MNWKKAISFALTSCAAMIMLMTFFVIGPAIETKFFPVYSKFEIVSVEPYGDAQSLVTFRYTKWRECEPAGSAWYAGEFGAAFKQITATSTKPSGAPRPLGLQLSNPFVIDAPPDIVRSAVFAEIYSRCFALWLSKSQIYP